MAAPVLFALITTGPVSWVSRFPIRFGEALWGAWGAWGASEQTRPKGDRNPEPGARIKCGGGRTYEGRPLKVA